ncbi:unnamed protein product [Spirodela intermedia]|uniref:Glycoside hydrolase family 5 domain-containing protein n=1 Tax=Spirodela intermedia TaxID=51605 RepID=A0A7I8J742_SPIIN|nr:unnamed protein product [Spirodela intermedia]CAA6665941.1 unnamed protein product [Spirodela intermedia]
MPSGKGRWVRLLLLLSLLVAWAPRRAMSLPLSTSGRWVVDAVSGRRVKLRCVNWAAHMPAVLAEGLDRKPVDSIAARVVSLGFNCVRLTWATELFTSPRYENLTVAGSLRSLALSSAEVGVAANNPAMSGVTAGLMAVLDNHVTRPKWCCGGDDGNGFFGDAYFDPEQWLRGLGTVARRFRDRPQVTATAAAATTTGVSLTSADWYRYVTLGEAVIHDANPDLLVVVSGLSYDTDLSFLSSRPLPSLLDGKLVFEIHWYSFPRRREWEALSPTRVCSDAAVGFEARAGFLVGGGGRSSFPLFVSEFGVDQRGEDRADNQFLSCFLAFAADRDLDWALWALQGSYYWRNGRAGFEETYGVLDSDWELPETPVPGEPKISAGADPGSSAPAYQLIYHPLSGQCLHADGSNNVVLSDCRNRTRWHYAGSGAPVFLTNSSLCLRIAGDGLPVTLSTECGDLHSTGP